MSWICGKSQNFRRSIDAFSVSASGPNLGVYENSGRKTCKKKFFYRGPPGSERRPVKLFWDPPRNFFIVRDATSTSTDSCFPCFKPAIEIISGGAGHREVPEPGGGQNPIGKFGATAGRHFWQKCLTVFCFKGFNDNFRNAARRVFWKIFVRKNSTGGKSRAKIGQFLVLNPPLSFYLRVRHKNELHSHIERTA